MGAESLFDVLDDKRCMDCRSPITFLGVPSEVTCRSCGLRMYLTTDGIGRYPREGWAPGGIQGQRRPAVRDRAEHWHPARGPQDLAEHGPVGRQPGRTNGRP
jgi:hypothetical protein